MISFKQIQYALAVAKHLHFRKAADEASVSQSTLSTAIAEMEKQLGFEVFERDNKKVLVSQVGKLFLAKAKEIQMHMQEVEQLVQSQKGVLSFPMQMGIIPTICPYLLPRVLPALGEQYPEFELNITEDQSAPLIEKVRSGELDTAIIALPYPIEGLLTFEFWQEDLFWVSHCDDKCASGDSITSEELSNSNLMLLRDGHCLKDQALSAGKLSSRSTKSLDASNLTTLIQLVLGRMGSTLIPELALDQLVNIHPSLKIMQLSQTGPHRRLAFIVRPNYANLNNIEALMALFKSELSKSS